MKIKFLDKKQRNRFFFLFFLIFPGLFIYAALMVAPIFGSMFYSFYTGSGLTPDQYVGFQNYIKLFTERPYNEMFFNALLNTLKFFLLSTILSNLGGFVLALMVTKKIKGVIFFRRIIYIPTTISLLVVGLMWRVLLNPRIGIVDYFLKSVGLESLIRFWLVDEFLTLPVIVVVTTWAGIGIAVILYGAGIDSVDEHLLEAANIDGASELQKIRYITIPLLVPILRLVTILNFVGTFTSFGIVFVLTGLYGGPNYTTDIFGTLFYRAAFGSPTAGGWGVGMGATLASVMFIIITIGILIWMRVFRYSND